MYSVQPFQFQPRHNKAGWENVLDMNSNDDTHRDKQVEPGQSCWCLFGTSVSFIQFVTHRKIDCRKKQTSLTCVVVDEQNMWTAGWLLLLIEALHYVYTILYNRK